MGAGRRLCRPLADTILGRLDRLEWLLSAALQPSIVGGAFSHGCDDDFAAHDDIQRIARDLVLPVKRYTWLDNTESETTMQRSIVGSACFHGCDDGFVAHDDIQRIARNLDLPVKTETSVARQESETIMQSSIVGSASARCCGAGSEAHDNAQCTAKDFDLPVKTDTPLDNHESETIKQNSIVGGAFAHCCDDGFETHDNTQCTADDLDLPVKTDTLLDIHESKRIKQSSIVGSAFSHCCDDAAELHCHSDHPRQACGNSIARDRARQRIAELIEKLMSGCNINRDIVSLARSAELSQPATEDLMQLLPLLTPLVVPGLADKGISMAIQEVWPASELMDWWFERLQIFGDESPEDICRINQGLLLLLTACLQG